ncbi:MAG: HEPN domain-containing protein [Bacteroidetes bacterium]|nr:HEPN domain-containing protein [Bacteroidota bacterium]MBU1717492.1 HEPN domain-containing protein [Bacteroidota bacterium]
MKDYLLDYIDYRISKSRESLRDAKILAASKSWNAAINRLYYSCYYMVSALMIKHGFNIQTHSGLKTQLSLNFVREGKLSKENGKLFSDLMDWRQKGDYGDMFDFDQETVESLIEPVENFLVAIEKLI